MFDRTLSSSWDDRSRRGFTTLTSFGLQGLVLTVLLVLPLLRPQGISSFHPLSTPISWGQPLPESPTAGTLAHAGGTASVPGELTFRTPSRIPKGISAEGEVAPPIGISGSAIPGSGAGDTRGVPNLFDGGSRPIMPVVRPPSPAAPVRISHISEGNLIRRVQPVYPPLARMARIQGVVALQAVISRDGTIENLKVLTGHPMLARAAVEAVSQWRYRPYILNNQPVEVETQITVNFSLAGN